jgi:hypothetical protein
MLPESQQYFGIMVRPVRIVLLSGFILLVCLIGFLVLFQDLSVNLLLAVSIFLILFVSLQIVKNWRLGVASIAIWFVVVDLIRKTMEGTKYLLMASDGLMLFVFCIFFLQYYFFGKGGVGKYIPKKVQLLLVGFGCIVIIQSLNPGIPEFILRIAGLRTYLFYILAIALGVFFLRSENDLRRLYKFLLFISFPVILLSFYQAALDPAKLGVALVSMEHKVRSFGIHSVDLISATFASSKRYGRFLFLVYPFIYGISVYYSGSKIKHLGLFLLFMAAAIVSSSREIVVILLLFHAMFWFLTSKRKINRYVIVVSILLSLVVVWYTVLNFENTVYDITEKNYRYKVILSTQSDWKDRFEMYTYGALVSATSEYSVWELFLGQGVGTYGQETDLIGSQEYTRSIGINRPAGDSGITKLLVELGMFGTIYFFFMYFIILRLLWRSIKKLKNHRIYPVAVAVFFIPVGWLILFLKAHTVISDGMMSFGLWFAIGTILSLRYYVATGRFPVVDQRRFT